MYHPRMPSSNKLLLDAFSLLLTKCVMVCVSVGVQVQRTLNIRQSSLCHQSVAKNNCSSLPILTVYCL